MSDRDVRYPRIADYGMLGDLRSAALLSKQGSIDWMCLPRFDYGRQVPALSLIRPGMLVAKGTDGDVFLQYPDGGVLRLDDGAASVTGRVMPGHRAAVLLHYTKRGGKRPAPISMDEAHAY